MAIVFTQVYEIVFVGYIDVWRWPILGSVYDIAVVINDGDDGDVGHRGNFPLELSGDGLRTEQAAKIEGVLGRGCLDHRFDIVQNLIDGPVRR